MVSIVDLDSGFPFLSPEYDQPPIGADKLVPYAYFLADSASETPYDFLLRPSALFSKQSRHKEFLGKRGVPPYPGYTIQGHPCYSLATLVEHNRCKSGQIAVDLVSRLEEFRAKATKHI